MDDGSGAAPLGIVKACSRCGEFTTFTAKEAQRRDRECGPCWKKRVARLLVPVGEGSQ